MVLQLKDLFDRAGEKQSFEYDLDLSHLRHGAGHPLVKPVHIIGTVENRTGIVTLGYLATFTLNTLCDRCLTPVERDLSMNFEHILVHERSPPRWAYEPKPPEYPLKSFMVISFRIN